MRIGGGLMSDITKSQALMDKFFESDKLVEVGLRMVGLILLIIIGLLILKVILHVMRKLLEKSKLDVLLYKFILNGIKALGIIILITMCLSMLGVQISTIVAVIGAAGAAIALALKDSLANIAGGVMIMVTKPFNKDDHIDIGEFSGKVKEIDLFITTLKTFDNKTITVPNGLVNTSILVNHSREETRRVDCKFSVSYDCDILRVKELMRQICRECDAILSEPEPVVGVSSHGDYAVIVDCYAWCKTQDYWDVRYFLEENVKKIFDENEIEIPFPKVDIQLNKSN